jgi:hypothetical protein
MTLLSALFLACRATGPEATVHFPHPTPPEPTTASSGVSADTSATRTTGVTGPSTPTSDTAANVPLYRCPLWFEREDPTNIVGSVVLSHIEDNVLGPHFDPPTFYDITSYEDHSVVVDPLEGIDDCIAWAPLDYDQTSDGVSAGTVTFELLGREISTTPVFETRYYYLETWFYDLIPLKELEPPIPLEDVWGQPLTVRAEGADLPPFELVDVVTFPPGPIEWTEPKDVGQFPELRSPDDIVFRWTPAPEGAPPLYVYFTVGNQAGPGEINALACFLEDDGEWKPPPSFWDYSVSDQFRLTFSIHRWDFCDVEIGPDQFVRVRAITEVGDSVYIDRNL